MHGNLTVHFCRAAARNGTISTVAVSAVLEQSFPSFLWIAHALDIFITVSVLVSFLAMSIGFKHVLDGIAVDVERVSVARYIFWSFLTISLAHKFQSQGTCKTYDTIFIFV